LDFVVVVREFREAEHKGISPDILLIVVGFAASRKRTTVLKTAQQGRRIVEELVEAVETLTGGIDSEQETAETRSRALGESIATHLEDALARIDISLDRFLQDSDQYFSQTQLQGSVDATQERLENLTLGKRTGCFNCMMYWKR
jgi:hypothetical protein